MDDDDDFEGSGGGPPVQLQFTNLQPKEWQSLQKELMEWLGGAPINIDTDVLELTDLSVFAFTLALFIRLDVHRTLNIESMELLDFIIDVGQNNYYPENPYHCFRHAVDVCQVIYHTLDRLNLKRFFSKRDITIILLSALCHDIGHPGLNNHYQTNGKTDLAMLYRDKSVLENYSCSKAVALIRKHRLLRNLSANEQQNCLSDLYSLIIATDMAHHFPLKADFERLIGEIVADSRRRQQAGGGRRLSSVGLEGATSAVQTTTRRISTVSADGKLGSGDSAQSLSPEESTISSESVSIRLPLSKAHRITMMRLLLHAADISNPCRHWVICKKWSDRVVDEFFLQGAYEKSQGLSISPNMDRDTTDQFQIALNFGDYIVKPFFELLASFAVEMSEFVDRLMDNRKQWVELEKDFRKRRLLEQQQQQDPHDQLTSPRFAHSRYPVSAPVAPGLFSNTVLDERNLNLPSALHGRRLSFAAGMITLPHKFNQQLKSPTALPHISFEFGGDRDSAFNEADSSHQSISLPRPQANAELDNADRLLKSLSLDKLSGGGALKRNESGETTWAAVTQQQGGGSGNQKSLNRRSRPAEQRLGSIIPENYFEATNSMNAGANRFAGDVLNANEKDPKLLYGSTSLLTASPTSKVRNVRRLSRPQNYLFRFSNKINQLTGENLRIQEQIATENDQPSQSTVNYLSARAKQLESLFDTSNGGTVNPLLTSKFTAEDDGDDDSAEDIEDEEGRLETVDEEKAAATPKPVAPKPTAATTAAAARRPRIFSAERSAEFLRRRFRCFVDGIEKRAAQSNQQLQVESDDFSPLGREKHRIRSTATFADILQQQSNSGKQSEHRRSLSEGLNTPPLSIIK